MEIYLYHTSRNKIMIINRFENKILLSMNEDLIDIFRSKTINGYVHSVSWEEAEAFFRASHNDKTKVIEL